METIIRVAVIYVFVLASLRLMGKREFSQMSPFELVTLLLIPELASQALIREDFSITNAIVALSTLFLLVFFTSIVSHMSKKAEQVLEGQPSILVSRGAFVAANMNTCRITPGEVYGEMHKAGLARLEQVHWAILESDGHIAVIPSDPSDKQIKARGETVL